ncbi:MAG: YHS domain-containing protein [Thermodesulfobacteriota bacterium]
MKKKTMTLILALVLAFSMAGTGWVAAPPLMESKAAKAQAACPVQGGKINKALYVDYKGQRIYFCCKECIPIFQKDPEAYLKKMREQGAVPERSPGGK